MHRKRPRMVILVMVFLLVVIALLAGCSDPRDAGREAGEKSKELGEDAGEFFEGFQEGCAGSLLPLIVLGALLLLLPLLRL